MEEKLQADGNTVTIYDVNIQTLSCMLCVLYALQGEQRLSQPEMLNSGT